MDFFTYFTISASSTSDSTPAESATTPFAASEQDKLPIDYDKKGSSGSCVIA
jgi:hypothetical protein